MIRILLVDDQNLVQQGIKSLLDQDSDLKVIGTVKDGRSAVNQIDLLRPDIVLLDIEMPGMDGITATKYISHLSPNTKVIILSSHEDKKYLTRALMAGAKAYILKDSLMKDLKQAILAVNGGYSHIESRLLAKIFDPNNLKLDGSKSEPETNKVNHQSQKPPSQKPPSQKPPNQKPPNQKPQSHSVHRTQNTPVNLQSQEISVAVPTAKQPLLSQDKVVSQVTDSVTDSDALVKKKPDASIAKPPTIVQTTVNSEAVNSEAVNSEAVNSEVELYRNNLSEDQEQNHSPVTNRFLPSVVVQRSSSKLSSTSKGIFLQLSVVVSRGKNYLRHIISKPQILKYKTKLTQLYQSTLSQCEPIVRSLKAKLSQYKSRLSPIIKRWYERGWLANAGLVLLGIITIIIIHRMFS